MQNTPFKNSKRDKHTRRQSVSQSVPPKYLLKAPTLIALLDTVNEDETTQLTDTTSTQSALAAEELTELVHENHDLFKQLQSLKAKYDDLSQHNSQIETELDTYHSQQHSSEQIKEEFSVLTSNMSKLQMENELLRSELTELKQCRNSRDSNNNTLSTDESSEFSFMKESLSAITQQKHELEIFVETEKQKQFEMEKTIQSLRNEVRQKQSSAEMLTDTLTKQTKAYLVLQQSIERSEREREVSIGKKAQLLDTVDQQKAYIRQLQSEKAQLMADKRKDDAQMFMELEQLRNTKLAKSVRNIGHNIRMKTQANIFDNIDLEKDTWAGLICECESESEYETEQDFEDFENIDSDDVLMSANEEEKTDINYYNSDDGKTEETKEVDFETFYQNSQKDLLTNDASNDEKKDTNENSVPSIEEKTSDKRPKKQNKKKSLKKKASNNISESNTEGMRDMEMDFFLLSCIAIKANLCEEYPDRVEVMSENSMKLFVLSQKQSVEMRKFNLWIELRLRNKYGLPKLRGFKKFVKRYGIKDKTKEKMKEMRKLAKYGRDYELPEMIRKYRKHSNEESIPKKSEYLAQIKAYSKDLLNDFKQKKTEYLAEFEYSNNSNEIAFFTNLFLRICKCLYYARLCGATFSAFEPEIERMCNGTKHDKITLKDLRTSNVWNEIYKSHLDFVIVPAETEFMQSFEMSVFETLCTQSTQFMKACYKSRNYAIFSGRLSHYICECMTEMEILNSDNNSKNTNAVIDDVMLTFLKILMDKKSFMKLLYKSVERNSKDPQIHSNTEYQLFYKMNFNNVNIAGQYEQILACIIVNLYCLECSVSVSVERNGNATTQLLSAALKEIDAKLEAVMDKCDELQIDEKTKAMIRFFFAYYLKGEGEFNGVCSTPVGCIIQ